MSESDAHTPAIDAFDELRIPRCPRLGDVVQFHYCRSENHGAPCPKIVHCWGHVFNVQRYLRVHFTPEQLAPLTEPPKPKVQSLIELIERAKKVKKKEEDEEAQEQ